ncbi:helix-turn-helix domain-containing protein [Microbispora sp. ATCC PTA-5024]|uniref:helix-turn-helix domain-containing protein n=1 Tax=Microbispora sp. ATCC PTA-5024 TaxID=316330 RepID=UPI0003DC1380|nr:helix-turn-helix transcriptional regulator [Microbispora sp. ATCC PTA-5024]ETK31656.1 hypothetical protein MPTA5024_34180 [Microbispora sp. ATCC PTA-5024]
MITIDIPLWAARLRALRESRVWSRPDLAARLRGAASEDERDRLPSPAAFAETVRRWESGERRPGDAETDLLCRAFGLSERDLFAGERSGTTLWHHLTRIPLVPGLVDEDEEERAGRAIERPERADEATVRYFQTLADACLRADRPPSGLAAALRPVFAAVEGFHRDARPAVRRSLLAFASREAELISRLEHEAGNAPGAREWSDRAIGEARECADTLLETYALVQRAGLVDATGPREAVEVAVSARERGRITAGMAAASRRYEARGHAIAGEEDLCHRCLEESAWPPGPGEPDQDERYRLDPPAEPEVVLCAGCLVDLGHAGGAVEILEQRGAREAAGGPGLGEEPFGVGRAGTKPGPERAEEIGGPERGGPWHSRPERAEEIGGLERGGREGGGLERGAAVGGRVSFEPGYAAAFTMARVAHAYAEAHERDRAATLAREALDLARRAGAARALRELAALHLPPDPAARRRVLL